MQLQDLMQGTIKHLRSFTFKSNPEQLYAPADYIMSLGGKHIRPILTAIGYHLYKEDVETSYNLALAMEIFHNFTLVHDDLMDEADLRRGAMTVHKKYSPSTAILTGDVMLIQAVGMIQAFAKNSRNTDVMDIFVKTATEVCEGQQLDMDFEKINEVPIHDYIEMIRMKTSSLLGGCIEIGACAAGADSINRKHLNAFAENFGIAFQVQDDVLDTFGSEQSVGKTIGGDILRNKKTYLYLKTLELADEDRKEELTYLYSPENTVSDKEKIERVISIMKDVHVRVYADELIMSYQGLSKSHLDQCDCVNTSLKGELNRWIESLSRRES